MQFHSICIFQLANHQYTLKIWDLTGALDWAFEGCSWGFSLSMFESPCPLKIVEPQFHRFFVVGSVSVPCQLAVVRLRPGFLPQEFTCRNCLIEVSRTN